MSAALRELRPVEIVGLYEDVLESFQVALLLKSHSHLFRTPGAANVHASGGGAEALLGTPVIFGNVPDFWGPRSILTGKQPPASDKQDLCDRWSLQSSRQS